ncbi:MAG: hypothetical protein QXI16_05410 [Sulfolobaceae archaeon]
MKQSIKLIVIIFILCLCGTYPVRADEVYQVNSDYTIYVPNNEEYKVSSMPPNAFYPDIIYSHTVHSNITCGNATYQFGQEISSEYDGIYTNIYETKISGGNNAGQIVGYTEEFQFLSDTSDTWESKFYFESKKACSGTVTLYAYKNNTWVQIESKSFNTYISYDDIVPDSNINGWKYVVHCTLNTNFTFLRYDNLYADGYTLNRFSWIVRSSQQQEEDTQKSIEENTRNTNTILGTVKNAIDNVKNAIDNVVTGIANLPTTILNGLKALFIPTDFYGDLETALNDIVDALGIVGYPISLYTDTCYVVRDTTTTNLSVDVPAFYYKGHTIFPRYHRDNIFYFQNNLVFENVQKTTWMRQFFGMFNADIDTITIGNLVKTLMSVFMWFGILAFVIRIYNKAFGLDVNEDMGGDDDDY